jgi:hypothetical protein
MVTSAFKIESEGERITGRCECCGNVSRAVWGFARRHQETFAACFVHWTVGHVPEHGANVDLILGEWGEGTSAHNRFAVSLIYRFANSGPSFMVVDAAGRDVGRSNLVSRSLSRAEVVGQPIAHDVFALCDAVLAQEKRVQELLGDYLIRQHGD